MGRKLHPSRIIIHVILIIGVLISIFPFYWMIVMATNETSAVFAYPPVLKFGSHLIENLNKVFNKVDILTAFKNTVIVVLATTVLKLFFDSLAGFVFAKYKFPAKNFLFVIMLATMMIPGQLSLIPQFIIMAKIGWVNELKALIIPQVVNAFGIFWIRQYGASSIPDELMESARMDGCRTFGQYWHVALPILRPALAFLGILVFMQTWEDYLWPLVITNSPDKFTIMIAIAQLKSRYTVDYSMVVTGSLISTVPLIIMFLATSRQFIAGISQGAVKG